MDTVLDVSGMTCGNCVRHVQHALERVDGVVHVSVDLETGTARVAHEARAVLSMLVAAVEEEGYTARARAAAQP